MRPRCRAWLNNSDLTKGVFCHRLIVNASSDALREMVLGRGETQTLASWLRGAADSDGSSLVRAECQCQCQCQSVTPVIFQIEHPDAKTNPQYKLLYEFNRPGAEKD
eukprot:2758896-Rhodomonas_salina.1